ncbi:hypothetical protein PsorP6_004967 [Peronosclerospora sorghi]|uniref:Uncharacterized protein n=1 Tax=Peronosclerospora sorghi TaxID=230839 RepID=A0ACC0W686_9STRA|nr:hypothetical protein PsorP6_004967 [Peronosclerospora sorghi]
MRRAGTAHELHKVGRELERRLFKRHIAWIVCKNKTEINVDHVAFRIEQQVAIVTIFDLQQVAHDRVASHATNKIRPRALEFRRTHVTKMPCKEVQESRKLSIVAFQRIDRNGIGNGFHES